jgi:hypothetical protein
MPLEQNLRGRLSLRDVYCWHLCTHFACFTLAFNPQIYGTGVYNAAVLAVSSACSHMFHSTSPCLGKSSAPWRQIFIAARHRLRQILHFLRPDPDLSTPKARAVTTDEIKCTWKVFFLCFGEPTRVSLLQHSFVSRILLSRAHGGLVQFELLCG